jgi:hypothetical protein
MRPVSLNPITLSGFKDLMKNLSYECILDQHPVLQFKKDGSLPDGHEKEVEYWPEIITFRHPDFASPKHNEPVYDSSEVLDFVLHIVVVAVPSTDRTTVAREISAILKTKSKTEVH